MRTILTLLLFASAGRIHSQSMSHTIYFDSGKSELKKSDTQWLDSVAGVLSTSSGYTVLIKAYCDSDGSEESNLRLSENRANAVQDVLKTKGLNPAAFTLNALGETDPLADNVNEAGKSRNRRALISISYQTQKKAEVPQNENDISEKAVAPKKEIVSKGLSSEKLEVGKTMVLKNLNFEGGTPILLPESEPVLKELLQIMKDNPTLEIEIGGHVCCGPDMELSVQRAKKVFNYLKGYGINANRMTYKGYSFDKPIASEATEEGKTRNRRVEITILKL